MLFWQWWFYLSFCDEKISKKIQECRTFNSRDGLEDPLDDSGMVTQQLDQMSVIARCEYGKTCQLLVQLFNNAAQTYQDMISNMGTSKIDISIQEG